MKIAFLIERRNFYRLFGPVVDRALERGWQTECWHDWGQPRTGPKGSEFPDAPPTFRHGRPGLRTYEGAAGLAALLATEPPDAIVAMRQPAVAERVGATRWFGLQYTLDVAELLDASGRTRCDGIGLHSRYWAERTPDCLRIRAHYRGHPTGGPGAIDDAAVVETLERVGRPVGIPEMDQSHWMDPIDVRRRLGLDPARPVVLYCPFPFRSNPRTFWTRHVFGARSALHGRLAIRLGRRPEYRSHVERHLDDRSVVRAVRAFCDRNGAALVVKARVKDPVPRYLGRCADRVLYDEHYYPATILELLRVSALCLHFFSTVAYEAVYAGVPSICIAPDADDLGFPPLLREWFLSTAPGSSFNTRGAVYLLGLEDLVSGFPGKRLSDFPLDPVARAQYVDKFIGFDDGKSSDRVLDAVQSLVERGSQR
jgi:hypothetical protein